MFNLSRNVTCPHCHATNAWQGDTDPHPDEALFCWRCEGFVTSHEEYIYQLVRREVSHLMGRYGRPGDSRELTLLKQALAQRAWSSESGRELLHS